MDHKELYIGFMAGVFAVKQGNEVWFSDIETVEFIDGLSSYYVIRVYHDGDLRYEHNCKNGDLHGISKCWREDGNLRYESNYKNDKRHGTTRAWYASGTMRYELNHKKDKKHGITRGWHEDGSLGYEENYKNGALIE